MAWFIYARKHAAFPPLPYDSHNSKQFALSSGSTHVIASLLHGIRLGACLAFVRFRLVLSDRHSRCRRFNVAVNWLHAFGDFGGRLFVSHATLVYSSVYVCVYKRVYKCTQAPWMLQ